MLAAACSGSDLTSPAAGSITVHVSTSGDAVDPDGYRLTLDGRPAEAVGVNATRELTDLPPGEHDLALDGVAPNCAIQGDNPRRVSVPAAGTAETVFEVSCGDLSGTIAVIISTTGESLDPDGFTLRVDGDTRQVSRDTRVAITDVSAGNHTVGLADLASNCTVQGENPRVAAVSPAGRVELAFEIVCSRVPATLLVTTAISGAGTDPDGFDISIDGGPAQLIAGNSSLALPTAIGASHRILLAGLAPFCFVVGPNPRDVEVRQELASSAFQVDCGGRPASGKLLYTGTVAGASHVLVMDPDGSGSSDLTPRSSGSAARWSPDRRRIVFESYRDGDAAVWVMDADGSHPTRLAAGSHPGWSPDGARIVFVRGSALRVMNADGTDSRQLTSGGWAKEPAWSPDGSTIVYSAQNINRCELLPTFDVICAWDIHTIGANGSNPRRLTQATTAYSAARSPVWSPDGSRLAFWKSSSAFHLPDGELQVMAADGTGLTKLTVPAIAIQAYPVWAPDGESLAFASRASASSDFDVSLISRHDGAPVLVRGGRGDQIPTAWR
jgi:TolB protein